MTTTLNVLLSDTLLIAYSCRVSGIIFVICIIFRKVSFTGRNFVHFFLCFFSDSRLRCFAVSFFLFHSLDQYVCVHWIRSIWISWLFSCHTEKVAPELQQIKLCICFSVFFSAHILLLLFDFFFSSKIFLPFSFHFSLDLYRHRGEKKGNNCCSILVDFTYLNLENQPTSGIGLVLFVEHNFNRYFVWSCECVWVYMCVRKNPFIFSIVFRSISIHFHAFCVLFVYSLLRMWCVFFSTFQKILNSESKRHWLFFAFLLLLVFVWVI